MSSHANVVITVLAKQNVDRIVEHNRLSGKTVVNSHRKTCQIYNHKLKINLNEAKKKHSSILRKGQLPPRVLRT